MGLERSLSASIFTFWGSLPYKAESRIFGSFIGIAWRRSITLWISRFMAKWILIVLLDEIGNPKRTLEYLWPRRKRIFSAASRFIGTIHRNFIRKASIPLERMIGRTSCVR